jgi:hypothetical protein
MKSRATELLEEVKFCEQNALETLVGLFDWLDGLQPQRIAEEQTRGGLEQMTGFLTKAKGVWRAFMDE